MDKIKDCMSILFRRKSLQKNLGLTTKLDRCLSTTNLIFYSLGAMAGLGIYVLTGHIIKDRAGPATNISMLLAGFICIFSAMCYCEFSTLIPKAGSCYTYTYIVIGELPAFIIGWTLIMDVLISVASITKGFSGTIDLMFNGVISNFTGTYLPLAKDNVVIDKSVDLVGLALIVILMSISITGAHISLSVNSWLTGIQMLFLLTITIGCFVYGNPSNLVANGGYAPFGFDGIIKGAGIAVFAYSGFENLANAAEEAKDPSRSIRISLFTSLSIIILLYFIASTGLAYLVPRLLIDQKSPFVAGFDRLNINSFKYISGIGVLLATGATKLSSFYLYPRLFYALANDGLIFRFLGYVNERTKAPLVSLLFGGIIISVLTMFVKIQVLADMTTMGILLSYCAIGINLLNLRYIYKDVDDDQLSDTKLSMRYDILSNILPYKRTFIILLWSLIIGLIFISISVIIILPRYYIAGIVTTSLFSMLTFVVFILLCFYEPKEVNHSFSTPLMPLTPVITICSNFILMINLPSDTWFRFIIWSIIGMLIYVSYGIWNSNLRHKNDYEEIDEIISDNQGDSNMNSEKKDYSTINDGVDVKETKTEL